VLVVVLVVSVIQCTPVIEYTLVLSYVITYNNQFLYVFSML